MTALLIVRAQVPEADRAAFDRWYEEEHLPQALAEFACLSAERGWSAVDEGVHVAQYRFATLAEVEAIPGSDGMARMVAEFDGHWQGRVTRTRDMIDLAQSIDRSAS